MCSWQLWRAAPTRYVEYLRLCSDTCGSSSPEPSLHGTSSTAWYSDVAAPLMAAPLSVGFVAEAGSICRNTPIVASASGACTCGGAPPHVPGCACSPHVPGCAYSPHEGYQVAPPGCVLDALPALWPCLSLQAAWCPRWAPQSMGMAWGWHGDGMGMTSRCPRWAPQSMRKQGR